MDAGAAPFAVRPARVDDAAAIQAIYAAEVLGGYATFEEEPPTTAEIERRVTARPRLPWLVAVDAGDAVHGFAFAAAHHPRSAYRWGVDVSIYLAPAAQRRGVGRALYTPLLATLTELGYLRAFAVIALPNAGSVALHQAFGFAPAGVHHAAGHKLGHWRDISWWERPLGELPDQPAEPREWVPPGR